MDIDAPDATLPLTDEDLYAARQAIGTYLDITDEDLKMVYTLALQHAQQRLSRRLPVSAVMTRQVITVSLDTSLQEAAALLAENRISGMPVVNAQQQVLGVLSEADLLVLAGLPRASTFADLLRRLLGEPNPVHRQGSTVGEVMSSPAITAQPEQDIREVAAILNARRIKRLPVVDPRGVLLGVIARADIVRVLGCLKT
ncbi:MAG: CBS domain-containing protein [Candidatus Tectimicrobiota bacterium]